MERDSTNENFEHFLRQNSEEFRMHPSSKVWDAISKDLNKKRRKYYFGFLTFIATSALVGYTFFYTALFDNNKQLAATAKPSELNEKKSDQEAVKANGSKSGSDLENVPSENITSIAKVIPITKNTVSSPLVLETQDEIETVGDLKERWAAQAISQNTLTGSLFNIKSFAGPRPNDPNQLNLRAENAINELKRNRKSNRFGLMFFFTPTISYRKLSENKSYLRSPSPLGTPYNYAALYDVNNAVTHKPDMGMEFGVTTKYRISKNIKLRAGVQFNISRYDIKAFKYVPEVATIALNNGRRGVDSLNTISNYRNFNGGKTDWLQNFYFQVAAPVGAEIKIHGNDNMYFGIASTVQPTYILGDRAYMITADYKNYAQVPHLIRRWNVNTNLETFVAYSTGKIKWQVGPQVRYQLLSSFISEYPVKENLFDFGLKVGLSVNQKDKSQ